MNLRSEPGKQNLNKLPADVRKELKCPPLHPSLRPISDREKSEFKKKDEAGLEEASKKLQDKTLSTKQWYKYKKKVETSVDNEGNVFSRDNKDFLGIEQCSPTLEDFKQFFLKEGIPPNKGTELLLENGKSLESLNTEIKLPETWYTPTSRDYPFELKLYIKIHEELWSELCRILGNMVYYTKTYDNEGSAEESFNWFRENILEKYKECLKDDEVPIEGGYSKNRGVNFRGISDIVEASLSGTDSFPHYGMLPQAIYACVLDFSVNHNGILSRLKQCPLCGTFWIKKRQRGRPNDYCSDCKEVFNRKPRDIDNALKADSRKKIKEVTIPIVKEEIKNFLCSEHGYTEKEAEKEYEKRNCSYPSSTSSLKAFKYLFLRGYH